VIATQAVQATVENQLMIVSEVIATPVVLLVEEVVEDVNSTDIAEVLEGKNIHIQFLDSIC